MIWEKGKKIDLETDFYYMILLKEKIILSIIILKRGFSNHTALFIILLSEVWFPSIIFPGPHRQTISSCSLRRTRSSPAALCMLD